MLDRSKAQSILLIAPAGYGKTSLAAEWLEGRSDVGWYRCTPGSADVAAFSVGVAERLAWIAPGAADRLRQRLTVPDSPEAVARPLAEMLAEELTPWPDGAWLVVDDYHLAMKSTAVEEFVEVLLSESGLRVLLTARRRPSWATARRLLEGRLLELTVDALTMTKPEAAAVLDGRPDDMIQRAVAQASGWPAVIGLAAIAVSREIPPDRLSDELYRYFAEEILRDRQSENQTLLLRSSIPQHLTLPVCTEVLGMDNAMHFIEDLRSSWLISEVVPDRYAFHPLLREFLRRRFEQDAPHQFHDLSRWVAAWAFTARDWEEFFAQAKAVEVKGELVEGITSAASELLNAGKIETLERYIAMCGTENELLPEIRLARAEVLYRRGSFGEAQALAEEVAQSLNGPSDLLSSAWYLAGRAANLRSLPRASRVLHGRAEASAVSVQCQSDARWGSFLASVEIEEEVEECRARLHELSASSDRSRARSLIADGMVFCFRGQSGAATKAFATALRIIERLQDPVLHTNALVQLAFGYFMRAEYLASCDRAREAITLANRFRLEFVVPYAETVLALSAAARGDHDAAHRHLAIFAADPDPYFRATSLWVKGRILAHELKLRSVLDIVEQVPREAPAYLRARVGSLGVLAAASLQEDDRARSMRGDLCAHTTDGYALAVADLALMSSARLGAETSESALETLFSSLLADELFDPIVLVTRVRPEVETLLRSTAEGRHTLDELFARARAELDLGPLGGAGNLQARISALTPRELEVLDLLELGCSNRDIARRLVISEATAKVHVRNVIRKLGVRTRLQAALVRRGSDI